MITVECPRCGLSAVSTSGTPTPCDICMVEIEFRLRACSTRLERDELWLPEEEDADDEALEEDEAGEAGGVPTMPSMHVDRSPRPRREPGLQGMRLDRQGLMTGHKEGAHVPNR